MRLRWAGLLAVLAAVSAGPAHAGECKLLLAAGLRIESDIGGRPLIPVTVEGRAKKFLVDTGAIYTMLTDGTARELNLAGPPVAPGSFIFVNGDDAKSTARARAFTIGRLPLGGFTFLVSPPTLRLPGADGALGPDLLHLFDVEFDFARNRLNIFSQDHCQGGVVYWTDGPHAELAFTLDNSWHMETTAMLDGKLVDVLIDTGAVVTSMTLEDAQREYRIGPDSLGMRNLGGDGPNAIYSHAFGSLDLQGVSIRQPTIVIRPDRTGIPPTGLRPELILGMTELSKLHLYVAYGERKIYLTAGEAR